MTRRTTALAAVAAALALPSAAGAHVTVHPNVIPEGAFAVLDLRVPNETEDADTTKVQLQLPDGFEFLSVAPPAGWTADVKHEGKEVSEVTFTGGSIPPGQFLEFPLSAGVPGKAGDTLSFKAIQTYSDGEVVRWIGDPESDKPASQVSISAAGGLIEDSTGEAGLPEAEAEADPQPAVVEADEGSDGLAIAALIVGALGLLTGGAALVTARRAA
jgi:periplasmic copper chaperone A